MLSKPKQLELKKIIISFINKGYSDNKIAYELNKSRITIYLWRKRFKIKTNYYKVDSIKIKKAICSILNKEKPQDCLSDIKLKMALKKKNILLSISTIHRCRIKLKIPPAFNIRGFITRQYLYYKSGKGRVVWMYDTKHYYIKNKESIF